MAQSKHIVFITCCTDDWGGSEELWAQSAPLLLNMGYRVSVYKQQFNFSHPEVVKIRDKGVSLVAFRPKLKGLAGKIWRRVQNYLSGNKNPIHYNNEYAGALRSLLRTNKPDLVLINQAINFDGLGYAYECLLQQIPYAIISHKAVDFFWPDNPERPYMIEAWKKSAQCFFVSAHNQRITEEQFGLRFTNAAVVWNPVKFSRSIIPFPESKTSYKFACIGRFFIIDKGQDILLRILSREPWKSRPVKISFIGGGPDELALKEMATLLDVKNVAFQTYQSDIVKCWETHHALILPSRSEGMPLVTIEAMAIGRPVIVTPAGGHAEIVQEGITGFIGEANENNFALAMEKAWNERHNWNIMGKNAHTYITQHVPESPEALFAQAASKLIQ